MDTAEQIAVPKTESQEKSDQPAAPAGRFRVWVEDETEFSLNSISLLGHNFYEHPLLQLDQLEALAHRLLPSKQCRFITPGAKQSSKFIHHAESPDGRGLSDVFANISEPGSWVALYNAETDPQYADLVNEAISSVEHLVDREQPGIFSPQAFIFISAPPSVTPFHIDRENNFWLQIHGRKVMNVWDSHDRGIIPAHTVESFIIDGSLHDVTLKDEFMDARYEWDLGPGEGVYFPSTSPHSTRTENTWVTPENGVTVSIGIVFYTKATRRHAYIHSVNRLLRRFNVSPRFPGESPFDGLKLSLGRLLVGLKRWLRGYKPPTGF